jgi:hypothetical protein
MSMSVKDEHALLKSEEIALVRSTHHPEIYELSRKDLADAKSRLRDMRSKAKTITRQKQREERGKSEARGKSFPGNAEQPKRRKQIFAAALKRINKEFDRLNAIEAKAHHVESARIALAKVRSSKFTAAVPASTTSGSGMAPVESRRRRRVLPRAKVGSVLKQNKVAQTARDARP